MAAVRESYIGHLRRDKRLLQVDTLGTATTTEPVPSFIAYKDQQSAGLRLNPFALSSLGIVRDFMAAQTDAVSVLGIIAKLGLYESG